jgi:cytochrome d ubiquinol oxidase subunit I
MIIVFYGFRLMLILAMAMFAVSAFSVWLRWKNRLYSTRWFLRVLVFMTPAGVFATLGGWYVAEVGRQPWVIYGVLHTRDAVSPIPAGVLASTLIAFVLIYTVFITAFLFFALRAIRKGPIESHTHPDASGSLKNVFRPKILNHPSIAFKLAGRKKS